MCERFSLGRFVYHFVLNQMESKISKANSHHGKYFSAGAWLIREI